MDDLVTVYVRKVTDGFRRISLKPPTDIPYSTWLDEGYAIDGSQVMTEVPGTSKDLRAAEQRLLTLLKGHEVDFV